MEGPKLRARGDAKREGDACEVLPRAEKVLTMPKRGHKTFWGSFYPVALTILKGGTTSFTLS